MNFLFTSKKIQEFKYTLHNFINTSQRCQRMLKAIAVSLSNSIEIQSIFLKTIPIQSPCFQTLKWLMIIHKCILQDRINRQTIQLWLSKVKQQTSTDLDKVTAEKLITPYQMYLKKRCYKLQFGFSKKDQLFYYYNLLNLSVGFIDYVVTLSRYYLQTNSYFIQLSVLLAIDVKGLYGGVCKNMGDQLVNLQQDLQKTHEKMYLIFYNCYFYKHTTKYAPKWITGVKDMKEFESLTSTQRKQRNRLQNLDMTFNENVDVSQFAHRKNVSFGVELSNNIDLLNRNKIQKHKGAQKIMELD